MTKQESISVPVTHYYEAFVASYRASDWEQALKQIKLAILHQEPHTNMAEISYMLEDYCNMDQELVVGNETVSFMEAIHAKNYLRAYQILKEENRSVKADSSIEFVSDLLQKIWEKNETLKKNRELEEKQMLVEKREQSYQEILHLRKMKL